VITTILPRCEPLLKCPGQLQIATRSIAIECRGNDAGRRGDCGTLSDRRGDRARGHARERDETRGGRGQLGVAMLVATIQCMTPRPTAMPTAVPSAPMISASTMDPRITRSTVTP
jgi:hypothetical protein